MFQVKNRLFQPLILHLKGGGTVHLQARSSTTLEPEQVSADVERAASRGLITLQERQPQPIEVRDEESQGTALVQPEPKPTPKPKPAKTRKGGRRK